MRIITIPTTAYQDQRPGTSGLRKKVRLFQEAGYLENFIQAIFEVLPERKGATLVLGGDGRYFNSQAIQVILKMAAANGLGRVLVGQNGILSTPAISHLIRSRSAVGGIILTASHNPGGPEHDFGVKYNVSNGGPAPEPVTERIWGISKRLDAYRIVDTQNEVPVQTPGITMLGEMVVEVCDSTADYLNMMEGIFDFPKISRLLSGGTFSMRYDALHAVTGPYAHDLFEKRLGAPKGSVVHGTPLPDFGGLHPDPNLVHAKSLVDSLYGEKAADFGAASDGDGDRHMILGRRFFVNPCDAFAVLVAHANRIPAYQGKIYGVARSMPTSRAVDSVAKRLNIPLYETPTGWKYFGDLMDAGQVTFCGEESFGAGSTHIREKDGLWAVLFWLSIIAETGQSVADIVRDVWRTHGRYYFSRHDFENLPSDVAQVVLDDLREGLAKLPGQRVLDTSIQSADDFVYKDPVNGRISEHQGIRILLADHSRIVVRISGTGTEGATMRLYFERFTNRPDEIDLDVRQMLAPLVRYAYGLTGIRKRSGREEPDVVT